MSEPLTIWLIGDGKPGHENQSLGLAEAIAELRPCAIHRISLAAARGGFDRLRSAVAAAKSLPDPDLVIGAGHATHLPILWLSRRRGGRSVVLMKPSMPMSWFDLCLVPEHDFERDPRRENVLLTKGAINRVRSAGAERSARLILVGGPSKVHGWDGDAMLEALRQVAESGDWEMTDSRRTPPEFLNQLREALPEVVVFPHAETASGWLPQKLRQAGEVWVSEDSVSMVYEALSSGARVGLLPVPRLRDDSRVLRGIDRLVSDGRLLTYEQWLECGKQLPTATPLMEADRCASVVIDRFG